MANLQVKNMPDELYELVRARARETNSTVSAVVTKAIEAEIAMGAWTRRLREAPATYLPFKAADIVDEERALRERASE